MRGDDNVVQVGSVEELREERVRVGKTVGRNDVGVCDKTVSPAHGVG